MFKDKQNIDVKDRILDVARNLFIVKGYNGTSIRDIAAASDTNVAMVNYYYHSKYNLFEIIFEEALDVLMRRVFSVVDSDKPFFELLEQWINSYYETLIEYPQIPNFIITEINQHPERLTERIQRRNPYNVYLKIAFRIKEEVRKGTIKDTPPLDFMLNILSLCIFPFVFGTMAVRVADKPVQEYYEILMKHKEYVIQFVIDALKA